MSTFSVQPFGTTRDGREISEIVMEDAAGDRAHLINFGAALRCLFVKDRDGILRDVCLGYDSLSEYEEQNGCLGATMGRSTNRTANACVTLSGREYKLTENRPGYHMHGGETGFNKKVWDYEIVNDKLVFTYVSPDGEEGYPGTLTAKVLYSWNADGTLRIEYDCVSDRETVINLTNHSYFNLNGQESGEALDHSLYIPHTLIADTDDNIISDGRTYDVTGTPLDFTEFHTVGERIGADFACLKKTGGYDHSYILPGGELHMAAVLRSDKSGIELRCMTDLPDLGLYTANFLSDRKGKNGAQYAKFHGVCLETQFVPNAANLPAFSPKPVFAAGEHYRFKTDYIFKNF